MQIVDQGLHEEGRPLILRALVIRALSQVPDDMVGQGMRAVVQHQGCLSVELKFLDMKLRLL